jgi:hypothetical protein
MCILFGYLKAALTSHRQYGDAEFKRHLHAWQLRKLLAPVLRRIRPATAAIALKTVTPASVKKPAASTTIKQNVVRELELV